MGWTTAALERAFQHHDDLPERLLDTQEVDLCLDFVCPNSEGFELMSLHPW